MAQKMEILERVERITFNLMTHYCLFSQRRSCRRVEHFTMSVLTKAKNGGGQWQRPPLRPGLGLSCASGRLTAEPQAQLM